MQINECYLSIQQNGARIRCTQENTLFYTLCSTLENQNQLGIEKQNMLQIHIGVKENNKWDEENISGSFLLFAKNHGPDKIAAICLMLLP